MNIKSIVGYIIAIVGVIIVAIGVLDPLKAAFGLESIKSLYIMIAGLIITIAGIIPIFKSDSGQKVTEVPIYHGKDVVGFRRLGKK